MTFHDRYAHLIRKTIWCWLWKGQRKPQGYGYIDIYENGNGTRRRVYAHRQAINAPDGMVVRHLCNNPPCVNPAHLALGSQVENAADMVRSGRSTGNVAPHLIEPLRYCAAAGVKTATLARMTGVRAGTINRIIRGAAYHAISGATATGPRNAGETHTNARLTEASVRSIRARAAAGERQIDIASDMNITPQSVNQIVLRRSWRHVQ